MNIPRTKNDLKKIYNKLCIQAGDTDRDFYEWAILYLLSKITDLLNMPINAHGETLEILLYNKKVLQEAKGLNKNNPLYIVILQEEEWFENLWEKNAPWTEFYKLAQRIDEILKEQGDDGLYDGNLTEKKFEEGWQYRTVLNEDYEHSRDEEWYSLLYGWW